MLLGGCHFFRAEVPRAPVLSGTVEARALEVDGRARRYLLYAPPVRKARAPLVVLLHGSRQSAQDLRLATGYEFERMADSHGFVAAYPEGYARRWNECRATGTYPARALHIDDVRFVTTLIDELAEREQIDPTRVFLLGYSSGAQLAFRAALAHPERVAAVAAFSANLPTAQNWHPECQIASQAVPVMLVNGTRDRINPFSGGRVAVFGFASRGTVRSARESAEFFAARAGLDAPRRRREGIADDSWDELRWYQPGAPEVMLLAMHGGGHVVPGPSSAFPRILGKVSRAFDGPREAWQFFARQPPASARERASR